MKKEEDNQWAFRARAEKKKVIYKRRRSCLFNKNYRFVAFSYKFVNCCFVYLIAGPESFN